VLADGEPALPAAGAVFDDVDPIAPLASDTEASHFGIPGDVAGLEAVDCCL